MQLVDKDTWSPRSTTPPYASSGSGVATQGPSRGWCSTAGTSLVSVMDADKHPDIDVTDDQFDEIHPSGARSYGR